MSVIEMANVMMPSSESSIWSAMGLTERKVRKVVENRLTGPLSKQRWMLQYLISILTMALEACTFWG